MRPVSSRKRLETRPGYVGVLWLALALVTVIPLLGHPGSGIVVDKDGQVYFTDTGQGIWRIDRQERLQRHDGPAFHFLAIDSNDRFSNVPWPSFVEPSTRIERVGSDPTLLVSSDFPLTVSRDDALYYPELGADNRLRIHRLSPTGNRTVLAILAAAADGSALRWLNGIATGPDGAIYFSENSAVRRISQDGSVSTIASNIVVEDCVSPPGASPPLGPFLRGLDVADDGAIYVAANGCCALLKITPDGQVKPILRLNPPWSPTGVAVSGDSLFVLEFLHTEDGDRREWIPRVRKITPDHAGGIIAGVERSGTDQARARHALESDLDVSGLQAGEEMTVGGMPLCWCPPGKFRMGSPPNEPGHRVDEVLVDVTFSKGFWIGKYEVTQGQWKRIAGDIPGPLNAGVGRDVPVYWVSYTEAEEFCRKLTAHARALGELPPEWEFRLPTEAQWEYACRAGSTTAFSYGDTLTDRQSNIGKPYDGAPPPAPGPAASRVGSYRPNAWGLHDMHGNEFEWCRDWYHARLPGGLDPDLSQVRGEPNRDGTHSRVRRGGAWTDSPVYCRSALRLRFEPARRSDHIGFRVVLEQP